MWPHTPAERIAKRELLEAVDLYVSLATLLVRGTEGESHGVPA